MSKKSNKKKVVVTKSNTSDVEKRTISPTVSNRKTSTVAVGKSEAFIFGKENYIYMGVGAALITLGMLLMSGGSMPDPNTWDPDIIYGFRRTVLAPIVILAGIAVEIYAIFK
ncbi:MAG: DUF3098 domain-containing protein [Saprospiraceae bacterium]